MSDTLRVEDSRAFLLHQRPYRESSALLEIFAQHHGRVGLVARGVRAARSRRRGELQLFRPLRLSWVIRGELGTLTGAESGGRAPLLQGDALYSAFYLNELLIRLLARQDPHPQLFERYTLALEQLAGAGPVEAALRLFEKALLDELGYGLQLDTVADSGAEVRPERWYDYHLETGPVEVAAAPGEGFVFRGSSLLALSHERLDSPEVLRDAKRLLRSALNLYLGDQPLKSRELFTRPPAVPGRNGTQSN